jgi:hypothetical protein
MLFLVRNGNPKNIKDWDDLIKPGVQVIVVNPKTGGNGRMAYLAAWGYVRKKGGTDAQAAEFVGKLYKNVPILAKGGRDATTVFLQRNTGDVLVTFESEVVSVDREFGAGKVDAIQELARWEGLDLAQCYAYSDSASDLPMMEAVGHPVAVNPDSKLERIAHRRGWPIVIFSRRTKAVVRRTSQGVGATSLAIGSFVVGVKYASRRLTD